MFGTGLRKVLAFFASAGQAKTLSILLCLAAVSQIRVRHWGGKEAKKRFWGRSRLWLHAVLRVVH